MARILSLVVSSIIVFATLVHGRTHMLFPHAVYDVGDCKGEEWENEALARFTGIFFGDFYTGGSQGILGALAVQGNFHAPNYVVNANHGADCNNLNSLNSCGLIVGGVTNTFNTQAHGSAYLVQGGTIEEVLEFNQPCIVTDQQGTSLFDFVSLKNVVIGSSHNFATLEPTAYLTSYNILLELHDSVLRNYELLNFHSCGEGICSMFDDEEFVPDAILFGVGNWNDIQGSSQIDPEKT